MHTRRLQLPRTLPLLTHNFTSKSLVKSVGKSIVDKLLIVHTRRHTPTPYKEDHRYFTVLLLQYHHICGDIKLQLKNNLYFF